MSTGKRKRLQQFHVPQLTPEEKAANNRYKIAAYQAKMKKLGYRKYQKWVPDEIRDEVDALAQARIDVWEKKKAKEDQDGKPS